MMMTWVTEVQPVPAAGSVAMTGRWPAPSVRTTSPGPPARRRPRPRDLPDHVGHRHRPAAERDDRRDRGALGHRVAARRVGADHRPGGTVSE